MAGSDNRKTTRILWWKLLVMGFGASAVGSLVGVGGGIIVVPILVMMGVPQKQAQGTSLLMILGRHPLVISMYWMLGNIDFTTAVPMAIGGIIGVIPGVIVSGLLSNRMLGRIFGLLLIGIAIWMGVNNFNGGGLEHDIQSSGPVMIGLFGMLAGFMAGFFGIGGGIVFVPTGVMAGGLGQVIAQGSGYVAGFPTVLTGFLGYSKKGNWCWDHVKWLIPGAWIGTVIGSFGADIVPSQVLSVLFSLFLLFVGTRMVVVKNGKSE